MREISIHRMMRIQSDMARDKDASEAQRQSNAARIDTLERLVTQLVRRIEDLEQRLPPVP